MATKISGANSSSPVQLETGKAAGQPAVQSSTGTVSSSQTDSTSASGAQISGSARQLAQLEQSLQSLPAVDEARVSEVRMAIDKGTYQVDSSKVADRLIQFENDLGRLQPDEQ